jgi:uncharacterized protein
LTVSATSSKELIDQTYADVRTQWGVKIPLRDGVHLNATFYLPRHRSKPAPAIFTLTPYVGQAYHDRGLYFAAHGYPFLTVDVRGRGNSEGIFKPLINEANDAYDIVEWLARQPYCNGKVAMWGGSYGGFVQWAAAKEGPPHLATIVPVASPRPGVDFPGRRLLPAPYLMQWLTLVWGRCAQEKVFWNSAPYWGERFRQWFESGVPFQHLDERLGNPSTIFQEWIAHPQLDSYWDDHNPTAEQYSNISVPVLTITGSLDGNQQGALAHYREHLQRNPAAEHYLVIGPWDHAGTRAPTIEFCGVRVGPASLIDLGQLHLDWYAWTMQGGRKPEFLRKRVAYYVMGADQWRYADSLDAVTERMLPLYLDSNENPTDVFHSGSLGREVPVESKSDHYVYDPRDVSLAKLESTVDPDSRTDVRILHASHGKVLVYHSAPFEQATEVSGFFRLTVWLAIDQPDTDFRASVYEVGLYGSAVEITNDSLRARHRESLREEQLIAANTPLRYDFDRFMFVSRQIDRGHRLRLVIGPVNSIYCQKNYNRGGVVSAESLQDARPVRVQLFHDEAHQSALFVPFAQPQS